MAASIGLHLGGPRTTIICHTYGHRTPILHISNGDYTLNLTLDRADDEPPTPADVAAVQDLVMAVLDFQADVQKRAAAVLA